MFVETKFTHALGARVQTKAWTLKFVTITIAQSFATLSSNYMNQPEYEDFPAKVFILSDGRLHW